MKGGFSWILNLLDICEYLRKMQKAWKTKKQKDGGWMEPEPHLSHFIHWNTISLPKNTFYSGNTLFIETQRICFTFSLEYTSPVYRLQEPSIHIWFILKLVLEANNVPFCLCSYFYVVLNYAESCKKYNFCFYLYLRYFAIVFVFALCCEFSLLQIFAPITGINTTGSKGYSSNCTKYSKFDLNFENIFP